MYSGEQQNKLQFHRINPAHPYISVYILHTVSKTFPMALTGDVELKIRSFSSFAIIFVILISLIVDSAVIPK